MTSGKNCLIFISNLNNYILKVFFFYPLSFIYHLLAITPIISALVFLKDQVPEDE